MPQPFLSYVYSRLKVFDKQRGETELRSLFCSESCGGSGQRSRAELHKLRIKKRFHA